jgi:shikimate dehydrogenase
VCPTAVSDLRLPTSQVSPPLQEIVCVLGQPVAGNPMQYMMQRAFAAAGLDWQYLTLEVSPDQLGDAIRGMRAMGFRGGNITLPHQIAVVPLLDELSESAKLMGAVNCVVNTNGKLRGENTDGQGFVQSLREICDPTGKHVAVLGAGGAASAIAVELALAGVASITLVNRTLPRAAELAERLSKSTPAQVNAIGWNGSFTIDKATDVVINATSIGLNAPGTRVPVVRESFRPGLVTADVVFNPPRTRFLEEAAAAGCTTLDGLGMLVNQAAIAFRLWTNDTADSHLLRESAEEFLGA